MKKYWLFIILVILQLGFVYAAKVDKIYSEIDPPIFPKSFKNKEEAISKGCIINKIKYNDEDTCVCAASAGFQGFLIHVYNKTKKNGYILNEIIPVESKYGAAKINLLDCLGEEKKFIEVTSEGNGGTDLSNMIDYIIGWDGKAFKMVFAETLYYQINSGMFRRIDMTKEINKKLKNITLHYIYVNGEDGFSDEKGHFLAKEYKRVKWQDTVSWDPVSFTFYDVNKEKSKVETISNVAQKAISKYRIKYLKNKVQNKIFDKDYLINNGINDELEAFEKDVWNTYDKKQKENTK